MASDIKIKYSIDTADITKAKNEFDKLTKEEEDALGALKKINVELGKVGDEADDAKKKLTDTFNEGKKGAKGAGDGVGSLSGIVGKLGPLVAGAFSVGAIVQFGKAALDVAGKYQRFASVLENTLGSGSAAQGALIRIQEIAASTPFSVEELTQSFVKLANQGFQPTNAQIIALGNLAASTGKSFDQLAEAIIDAQVGEFERLKEFGIRASKQGDQIKFTFKGVETTVRNTSTAIREYVTSLGDAVGVGGAMEKQSKTLEGSVSNLGDAWDSLLNNIGQNLLPIYQAAIQATAAFLGQLKELFKNEKVALDEFSGKQYNAYADFFVKTSDTALGNIIKNSKNRLVVVGEETKRLQAEYEKQVFAYNLAQSKAQDEKGSGFAIRQKQAMQAAKAELDQSVKLEAALKAQNQAAIDEIKKRADARSAAEAQATKDAQAAAEKALKNNTLEYNQKVRQLEIEKQITDERIKQTISPKGQQVAMMENQFATSVALLALAKQYGEKGVKQAQENGQLLTAQVATQNQDITNQYIKDGINEREARVDAEQKTADDLYKTNMDAIAKNQSLSQTALETEKTKLGDALKNNGLLQAEYEKKSLESQIAFNNDKIAENDRAANEGVVAALDANDQILADNKRLGEEIIQNEKRIQAEKMAIAMAAVQATQQITDGAFNLYQQNLANELTAVQKRYDEEVRLADGNKQKIDEAEQKRREKEKEIRTAQFRAQQAQAIANVIFNTAPLIAQYIAGVFTGPLAAIAIAAQAAQIGFILAQPVPEFAEGTKGKKFKGGKAIVGERGTERIVTESGKVYYTPPTATLVDLPKGSQVIPNHLLSQQEIAYATSSKSYGVQRQESISGQLAEIGGILKGLPIHQINMDEKGFEKYIRTPNRTAKILNNRFGIKN